jgi:hypothetical protein
MTVKDRFGRVMATIPPKHISKYVQAATSLCVCGGPTVEASLLAQEPDLAVRIAPDEAHYYSLFLPTLESIHAPQLYARKSLLERGENSKLISAI